MRGTKTAAGRARERVQACAQTSSASPRPCPRLVPGWRLEHCLSRHSLPGRGRRCLAAGVPGALQRYTWRSRFGARLCPCGGRCSRYWCSLASRRRVERGSGPTCLIPVRPAARHLLPVACCQSLVERRLSHRLRLHHCCPCCICAGVKKCNSDQTDCQVFWRKSRTA